MSTALRYGFELDREYFIDYYMTYQFYMPIICLLTIHPILQYFLIFETKSMKKDIRVLYILTHQAQILNEWTFCFAFRIYTLDPFAGLYCEGPICRAGINKQLLMLMLSTPVILIVIPFIPLSGILHQMFLPPDSKWLLSSRTKITLVALLNLIMIANVVGFGYFGKDHDDSGRILQQEPELAWLIQRGGMIFLFGPPADPQYFKWELLFLALSILLIAPFLTFFTAHAVINISKAKAKFKSRLTQAMARRRINMFLIQCMGSFLCYILPLTFMLSCMIFDATYVPGTIMACLRLFSVIFFSANSPQFCIFFILLNPAYKKALATKFMAILCTFRKLNCPHHIKPTTSSSVALVRRSL